LLAGAWLIDRAGGGVLSLSRPCACKNGDRCHAYDLLQEASCLTASAVSHFLLVSPTRSRAGSSEGKFSNLEQHGLPVGTAVAEIGFYFRDCASGDALALTSYGPGGILYAWCEWRHLSVNLSLTLSSPFLILKDLMGKRLVGRLTRSSY
jgi:hypothetical protein